MIFPCYIEYITKSSKATLQFCTSDNTICINRWNVAGALRIPKAITINCMNASGVTKAEITEAHSVNGTCQYPFKRSSLVT